MLLKISNEEMEKALQSKDFIDKWKKNTDNRSALILTLQGLKDESLTFDSLPPLLKTAVMLSTLGY